MFPTQEGLSEALRDEAQLKEEADGAPAQTLGQGSGIVDGQVVELPRAVESALKDEGVEVRVEIAAGAIRGLSQSGLRPGTDCSVIGCGNTLLAQAMGMSTIDPCYDRLSERIVSTVLEAMNRGAFADDHFSVSPELRVRDTSARMKLPR